MSEKYDVGVFGVWYGCNYGSIATYYALNTILKSMGKTVLMLDKPVVNGIDPELSKTHSRRFAEEWYDISKRYRINELEELNDICEAFLIGSDQLWNYGISKGTGKTFYLDFVHDDRKKIAYATSFGHAVDFAPAPERKKIAEYMARFDGISLREDDGVKICERDYGINAIQVLDPVFLADPEIYQPLIAKSDKKCEEPYLLSYILDPTSEKRAAILHIAEKLGGVKIINVLDGLPEKFEKNKNGMNLPNCIENVQVEDWLSYLNSAQFVITDSCHGASFALIFKKNFIAICNKGRGFSRFQSLSRLFHLQKHIVTDAKMIMKDPSLLKPVDYAAVNRIMIKERSRCYDWLKEILDGKKKSKTQLIDENIIGTVIKKTGGKTITSNLEQRMCSGCSACVSACPVNAITLKMDQWGYYRSKVDYGKCIECGKCLKVCPALKLPENDNTNKPDCFEFISSDEQILRRSSSGGIFTTMARMVLERGGVVAGAAWKDDFSVGHILIDREEDLWKLQKSKYLQSDTGDCFAQTQAALKEGKTVLFTGTPCQIAGLKAFLKMDSFMEVGYVNLITVDLLCGNAPSTMFFQKYLAETFGDDLNSYEFRHKSDRHRWDSIHIEAQMKNGLKITHSGPRDDNYQRVYHSHTMCAYHCEHCRYQAFPRQGDLTIGDFWGIGKLEPDLDTFQGVSIVLCNSERGKSFYETIPEAACRVNKKVPLSWMGGNGYSRNGGHNYASPNRNKFYEAILEKKFSEAVNYALKPNKGVSRNVYRNTNSPLVFDRTMQHFHFENNIWEEVRINGCTTLIVKPNKWNENGHYARLSMCGMLKKGVKYRISAKFKIKSESKVLNFHVIDSGSMINQLVHSENIDGNNRGTKWIDFTDVFIAETDFFDEFMFGASQVSGANNYLMIEYINVSEEFE